MALQDDKFADEKSIQDKVWQYVTSHPELLPKHIADPKRNPERSFDKGSMNDWKNFSATAPNISRQLPSVDHPFRKSLLGDYSGQSDSLEKALSELSLLHVKKPKRTDHFPQLTSEIESFMNVHCQSQQLLDKKLNLRSALLSRIQRLFPRASVHLVGSSCNGFACNDSDADLCVMFNEAKNVQPHRDRDYLLAIERIIQYVEPFTNIEFVSARVPILKFKDTICGCWCDLSVNNGMGIRNVHLLRTYSKVDKRVKPIVIAVKKWAKARKINDASQGTLSSYAIILMTLHYLQCGCFPPVLNSLQKQYPQHFRDDSIVDNLPYFEPAEIIPCNSSKNQDSVGELLIGFFNYFSERFSWDTQVMSVYLGCTLPKRNYRNFSCRYINVEEPFEFYNTARTVYNHSSFIVIKEEFRRANARLKEKPLLERIF